MSLAAPQQIHPELHSGDSLSREAFHALYEQMPDDFQAELIGGVVYVASPLRRTHGILHALLGTLFCLYESRTPGVEVGDNATVLLGEESEPQPDLYLRILPEYGGQSQTSDSDYVTGPPELVAEIAHGSASIDLHGKYEDYRRHGVQEYLVVCLREKQVRCFDLPQNTERKPDSDGIFRLTTFPGLWIHGESLINRRHQMLMDLLQQGLASAEHDDFVNRLQKREHPGNA